MTTRGGQFILACHSRRESAFVVVLAVVLAFLFVIPEGDLRFRSSKNSKGHGFSRAVTTTNVSGLQPLRSGMKINLEASKGWLLREAPFPFQQTYITALTDLPKFVNTILEPLTFLDGAVWIEQIVFEPRELIWYLRGRGFVCDEGDLNKAVLTTENKSETAELLECILGQWTDFAFIPSPKNFVIYADHDEFTTIFAPSAEILSSVQSGMKAQGFKAVEDWIWTRSRSQPADEKGINA
jgi:hypothetical protein